MKKNILKKIGIIIILLFLIIFIKTNAYAELSDPMINPDVYKPSTSVLQEVKPMAGQVIFALRNLSVIISVVSVMILGIKYIFGSVEEKADYKKTIIPMVIGMIIISSIFTIINIIYNASQSIFG